MKRRKVYLEIINGNGITHNVEENSNMTLCNKSITGMLKISATTVCLCGKCLEISINNKIKNEKQAPYGRTCHYERINKKWYVVWSSDFLNDKSGSIEVNDKDSFLLEVGYTTRCTEETFEDEV